MLFRSKGVDIIEIAMVTGDDLKVLSDKMVAMVEEHGMKFFLRDAANILQAECVIIIGTREQAQGLNCGHCGYPTCAGRPEGVPCAVNSVDVGIAIGSACATAADLRVDTRVMFLLQMRYMKLQSCSIRIKALTLYIVMKISCQKMENIDISRILNLTGHLIL